MADKTLSKDLSIAEVKKSGMRDALEHLHERASSLLLLSLQWKDLEEHYEATQSALERREEEVRCVEESVKASFGGFAARLEEMESREREIAASRWAEVERRCKELERNAEELEAAKRAIEERLRGIEGMEKRFEEVRGSLGALIDERLKEVGEREKEIEFRNEKLREGWEAFEASRSKLEGKLSEVQLKSAEFEGRIKDLELIEKKCDERVREVGLKEKRLQEWSNELEKQKRELEMRLREVELKDKRVKELSKELDVRSKKYEEQNNNVRPVINKSSDEIHAKVLAKSPNSCLKIVGRVGKDLQIFLNERWTEGENLKHEVLAMLRKCPDPARLVLDAMEGFYPPHLKKGDVEFDECIARRSCILLLELLMKISPNITPQVKTEATKLSFFWITKMRADAGNSLEVLGFLQLLATYGLASAFDTDEILLYVEKIAHFRNTPELCLALDLKDKIPGVIRNLVKEKKYNPAVRFIYAFNMEDEFPTEPLLEEAYLRISKDAAGANLQHGDNSPEAQVEIAQLNQATKGRVADLEAGDDHKIKSTISPGNTERAITSMEKQNRERQNTATEIGSSKMRELNGKLHSPATVAAPVPSSIPASVKTTSPITIDTAVKPAPETSTCPRHRGKHPQTAALAEVVLNSPAGASSNAQSSHIAHKVASSENLCSESTGKILGKLLSRELEYESMRDEVSSLLQSSSDPASLVLHTLRYSDPSNSREFIRLGIPPKHCILLLEHLKRFSPLIKPQLSQEAKQFCTIWKLKLKAEKDDHMEIICFLQFLATFKLAPLVAANEVLSLLDPWMWAKLVPDSCESLGLGDFLPGFIRNLIEKKHWIDAIKYINALKMEDKFPLAPLLTDYLAYWENRADEISEKENPSSQIRAIDKKLTAVKIAMKWIVMYRLESEFLPKDFKAYIKQLEKQRAEIEGKLRESEADSLAGSQHVLTQQDKKEVLPAQATPDQVATSCVDTPQTVTASTAATSATSSRNQPQKKRGKKRKRKAPQTQTPPRPTNGGHPSMQPVSTHGYQMGPLYSARSSGYFRLPITPNHYAFNPYRFSGFDRYHGRNYQVPLCGGRPVRFAGPRDAHSGPR